MMANVPYSGKFYIFGKYLCAFLLFEILFITARDESNFRLKLTQGLFNSESENKTFNCSFVSPYRGVQTLLKHIYTPTYTCKYLIRVGEGLFFRKVKTLAIPGTVYNDGTKFVCMDKWLHLNKSDCLIYSFGISNIWSFDDEMAAFGCHVHSFDPTIGLADHKRTFRLSFHNLGIAAQNGTMIIDKKLCKVARLEEIIKMLGHENKKIDYLKVDIEGSEIPVFADIFENNYKILTKYIMQIGMEIHLTTFASSSVDENHAKKHWDLLQKLSCFGFKLVHNDPNEKGEKLAYANANIYCCYELLWVNTNFIQ